jgi:hypothetical protein
MGGTTPPVEFGDGLVLLDDFEDGPRDIWTQDHQAWAESSKSFTGATSIGMYDESDGNAAWVDQHILARGEVGPIKRVEFYFEERWYCNGGGLQFIANEGATNRNKHVAGVGQHSPQWAVIDGDEGVDVYPNNFQSTPGSDWTRCEVEFLYSQGEVKYTFETVKTGQTVEYRGEMKNHGIVDEIAFANFNTPQDLATQSVGNKNRVWMFIDEISIERPSPTSLWRNFSKFNEPLSDEWNIYDSDWGRMSEYSVTGGQSVGLNKDDTQRTLATHPIESARQYQIIAKQLEPGGGGAWLFLNGDKKPVTGIALYENDVGMIDDKDTRFSDVSYRGKTTSGVGNWSVINTSFDYANNKATIKTWEPLTGESTQYTITTLYEGPVEYIEYVNIDMLDDLTGNPTTYSPYRIATDSISYADPFFPSDFEMASDFESSSLSGWDNTVSGFQTEEGGQVTGSKAGAIDHDGNAYTLGTLQTGSLQVFKGYLKESSSSNGVGIEFLTDNRTRAAAIATFNPQWTIYSGGETDRQYQINNGSYDTWYEIQVTFQYRKGKVIYELTNVQTGDTFRRTTDLLVSSSPVTKVEVVNANNGGSLADQNGGGSTHVSLDSFEKVPLDVESSTPDKPSISYRLITDRVPPKIEISWSADVDSSYPFNFRLERKPIGGEYSLVDIFDRTESSYSTILPYPARFKYRIRGEKLPGNSNWAETDTIYVEPPKEHIQLPELFEDFESGIDSERWNYGNLSFKDNTATGEGRSAKVSRGWWGYGKGLAFVELPEPVKQIAFYANFSNTGIWFYGDANTEHHWGRDNYDPDYVTEDVVTSFGRVGGTNKLYIHGPEQHEGGKQLAVLSTLPDSRVNNWQYVRVTFDYEKGQAHYVIQDTQTDDVAERVVGLDTSQAVKEFRICKVPNKDHFRQREEYFNGTGMLIDEIRYTPFEPSEPTELDIDFEYNDDGEPVGKASWEWPGNVAQYRVEARQGNDEFELVGVLDEKSATIPLTAQKDTVEVRVRASTFGTKSNWTTSEEVVTPLPDLKGVSMEPAQSKQGASFRLSWTRPLIQGVEFKVGVKRLSGEAAQEVGSNPDIPLVFKTTDNSYTHQFEENRGTYWMAVQAVKGKRKSPTTTKILEYNRNIAEATDISLHIDQEAGLVTAEWSRDINYRYLDWKVEWVVNRSPVYTERIDNYNYNRGPTAELDLTSDRITDEPQSVSIRIKNSVLGVNDEEIPWVESRTYEISPAPVESLNAVKRGREVELSWNEPKYGGGAYLISAKPNGNKYQQVTTTSETEYTHQVDEDIDTLQFRVSTYQNSMTAPPVKSKEISFSSQTREPKVPDVVSRPDFDDSVATSQVTVTDSPTLKMADSAEWKKHVNNAHIKDGDFVLSVGGELSLTEVNISPGGQRNENVANEYIALTNVGEGTLNLSGATVTDRTGYRFQFPTGSSLNPGETIRVHTGKGEDSETDVYWGKKVKVWEDSNDIITVRSKNGEVLLEENL